MAVEPFGDALRLTDPVIREGRVQLPLQSVLEIPSRLPVSHEEEALRHMTILRNHAPRMAQPSRAARGESGVAW
ncbi:hypothetical protein GCM10009588_21120 [Microbacterium phyllosphaerae]